MTSPRKIRGKNMLNVAVPCFPVTIHLRDGLSNHTLLISQNTPSKLVWLKL